MSKQNVIKKVQDSLSGNGDNVTQREIGSVFNAVFDVLGDLDENQSCRVRDFGIFKVKLRQERKGSTIGSAKTPAKKITIPARLAMTFKISKNFKDELPAAAGAPAAKKKAPAKKKAAKKKAAKKKSRKK